MESIKILGGGIAGLSSAINLCKAGADVTVYENKKVGMRFLPNSQLLGNWDTELDIIDIMSSMNVKIRKRSKLDEIVFLSPSMKNKAVIHSDERPVGYYVQRGGKDSLECDMAKQASKLGAKIITGSKRRIVPDITATGPKRADAVGYGCVFKGSFDKNKAVILLDNNYAPKGYVYLLPHSSKIATFAVATFSKWDSKLLFEKVLNEQKYFREIIDRDKILYNFSGVANFKIPETAKDGKSLLVGESAGFQDAAFGFGMRYAVQSGYLAAKAISESKDYDELWKSAMKRELEKTLLVRRGLNHLNNMLLEKLILKLGNRSIGEFSRIWMSKRKMGTFYIRTILGI